MTVAEIILALKVALAEDNSYLRTTAEVIVLRAEGKL